MKPRVNGILESALYVDDVSKSADFYTKIFGFVALTRDDRFCALTVGSQQVLLLFRKGEFTKARESSTGTIPGHDGHGTLHVAFAIEHDQVDAWRQRLQKYGVAIESTMRWSLGGVSLYCRDPDNHVVELATPGTWEIF